MKRFGRMFSTSRIWRVDGVAYRLESVRLDVKEGHRLQRRRWWMGVVVPLFHRWGDVLLLIRLVLWSTQSAEVQMLVSIEYSRSTNVD